MCACYVHFVRYEGDAIQGDTDERIERYKVCNLQYEMTRGEAEFDGGKPRGCLSDRSAGVARLNTESKLVGFQPACGVELVESRMLKHLSREARSSGGCLLVTNRQCTRDIRAV